MRVELKTAKEITEAVKHINHKDWIKPLVNLIHTALVKKEYKIYKDTITNEIYVCGNIAQCEITCGNVRLIETEQRFKNGKVTHRNMPVGGKIPHGVKPEICLIQEIHEEINIDYNFLKQELEAGKIVFVSKRDFQEPSLMYAGTMASYTQYLYKWEMPMTHFKTKYIESANDKECTFEWVPKESL